jgi:ABC-2 type transport system ATP-binding protein
LTAAVRVASLTHHYGDRRALDGLTLAIDEGEVFVFLGPNGGGKTTLFRILSTLIPPQAGQVDLLGRQLPAEAACVRAEIGVAFQAPSLDKKLTVLENLRYQAALYGMAGAAARRRAAEMLDQLGVADRAGDLVETLSGRTAAPRGTGQDHDPRAAALAAR